MTPGEEVSATLVNELSRIEQIGVLPFRPLRLGPGETYATLGRELGVDAFVTGSLNKTTVGSDNIVQLSLQIISASDGRQLWGETLQRPVQDGMLNTPIWRSNPSCGSLS